jgi:hypothetical protein
MRWRAVKPRLSDVEGAAGLLQMADVCGKRELFVFSFSKGDGESVMESLASLVEIDESGLALLSILEEVYRSDSV